MKQLLKITALLLIMMIVPVLCSGQGFNEILDLIKNTESWEQLFALYDVLATALIILVTELSKYIPWLKNVKGKYLAALVTVIILVSGAIMFGIGSFNSPLVIFSVVTIIYDKFIKKETAKSKVSR